MVPTRWPAAWSTLRTMAATLPLPFVPATSAPRRLRSGRPSSSSRRSTLSSPRLIPNRPRACSSATADGKSRVRSVALVLVEDAIREGSCQAQIGHVARVEVHPAAQLASAHHAFLLHQRPQQLGSLDRHPSPAAVGQVEVRARVPAGSGIAERHSAPPDVHREWLGGPSEPLLGDRAAPRLAVVAVVTARPGGTDPLDRPQLPAWAAEDERRAAVADGEVAVLDLPAHRPAISGASLRRERVADLPSLGPRASLGLDDHGQQLLPGPLECSGPHG